MYIYVYIYIPNSFFANNLKNMPVYITMPMGMNGSPTIA